MKKNTEISEALSKIKTGDEIQVLSSSLLKMETNINEYIENIKSVTAEKERIGADRMLDALNSQRDISSEQLLSNVKSAVDNFVGSAPQFDDLTMLGFTYYGKGE